MNGVNLIDFIMPTAVPASATRKAGIRNVGGMKLILPRKARKEQGQTEAGKEKQAKKADWWKALIPLLGILIVIKLATWMVRRKR